VCVCVCVGVRYLPSLRR